MLPLIPHKSGSPFGPLVQYDRSICSAQKSLGPLRYPVRPGRFQLRTLSSHFFPCKFSRVFPFSPGRFSTLIFFLSPRNSRPSSRSRSMAKDPVRVLVTGAAGKDFSDVISSLRDNDRLVCSWLNLTPGSVVIGLRSAAIFCF